MPVDDGRGTGDEAGPSSDVVLTGVGGSTKIGCGTAGITNGTALPTCDSDPLKLDGTGVAQAPSTASTAAGITNFIIDISPLNIGPNVAHSAAASNPRCYICPGTTKSGGRWPSAKVLMLIKTFSPISIRPSVVAEPI